MAALQLQVDKLETMGVNKIIALGHSGFLVDQDIARKVRGVDVVVGGHTNTFLFTGEMENASRRPSGVDRCPLSPLQQDDNNLLNHRNHVSDHFQLFP